MREAKTDWVVRINRLRRALVFKNYREFQQHQITIGAIQLFPEPMMPVGRGLHTESPLLCHECECMPVSRILNC
jgi:hypothetical protein